MSPEQPALVGPKQPDPGEHLPVSWDAICASLPLAAAVFDAAGRPVWANAAATTMLGIDATAMSAALLAERLKGPLSFLDSLQTPRSPIARALAGESVRVERFVLTGADGERTAVWLWAAPVRRDDVVAAAIVLWQPADEPAARADPERSLATSRRLVEMQEAERRRVARELHDEVGQALTAVKINLQALEQQGAQPQLAGRLQDSIAVVERALQQVRNISLDLRPSLLDDLGLVPALRWYVDSQARRAGLAARFTAMPADLRLAPHLETHCFRVAQEAITNVIRHAHATQMDVSLDSTGHGVRLIVRDNGVGFNVAQALEQSMHGKSMGLSGLRERAALIGGRVDIFSKKGHGTEVRAWFPAEPDAAAGEEEPALPQGA
ncbi:MAG: histidine kinase [Anaerolineae bacterium]